MAQSSITVAVNIFFIFISVKTRMHIIFYLLQKSFFIKSKACACKKVTNQKVIHVSVNSMKSVIENIQLHLYVKSTVHFVIVFFNLL